MHRVIYTDLLSSASLDVFSFQSVGPKGSIEKLVVYSPLKNLANGYNLGFGTAKINEHGQKYIDGEDRTNNGDRDIVLATVARTAYIFSQRYPDRKIYLNGYIPSLTRLYQMAIVSEYIELAKTFIILGDKEKEQDVYDFEPFTVKMNYFGFLAERLVKV